MQCTEQAGASLADIVHLSVTKACKLNAFRSILVSYDLQPRVLH